MPIEKLMGHYSCCKDNFIEKTMTLAMFTAIQEVRAERNSEVVQMKQDEKVAMQKALQKEKEKEELRKQQEEEAEKERTEYGYVEFHHYPLVGIHYRGTGTYQDKVGNVIKVFALT